MSNNVVNFSSLKREDIKCLVFENIDGGIVVENNSERIAKILKNQEIENPIIIYNPDNEKQTQIKKIINNSYSKETKEIIVSEEDLILNFLPILTNINLDLNRDNVEEMQLIKKIINDPSLIFARVINIIKEIIKEISIQYISRIKDIAEMPKEQREELFKNNTPELSEKEKKKLELQKQQEEIQKKMEELDKEE